MSSQSGDQSHSDPSKPVAATHERKRLGFLGIIDSTAKAALPIVIFLVGSYFTYTKDTNDRAQKALDRCIDLGKSLDTNSTAKQKAVLGYIESLCGKSEELKSATIPQVVQTTTKSSDPEIRQTGNDLALKASANTAAAEPVKQGLETSPRIIYLHIPDENSRTAAGFLKEQLDTLLVGDPSQYLIAGIENVGIERSLNSTVVKYFRDEDKAAADKVTEYLTRSGVTDAKSVLSKGTPPPYQLEVWFGRSSLVKPIVQRTQ